MHRTYHGQSQRQGACVRQRMCPFCAAQTWVLSVKVGSPIIDTVCTDVLFAAIHHECGMYILRRDAMNTVCGIARPVHESFLQVLHFKKISILCTCQHCRSQWSSLFCVMKDWLLQSWVGDVTQRDKYCSVVVLSHAGRTVTTHSTAYFSAMLCTHRAWRLQKIENVQSYGCRAEAWELLYTALRVRSTGGHAPLGKALQTAE